jgi:lipid-A-disaccharide synthase
MKKIFIIAGESSGDFIGSLIIKRLNESSNYQFKGIGGAEMQKQNLDSIFPMDEISLMGFFEILPHIFKLKKLIKFTKKTIEEFNPDIVITIDSPGFCYRIASSLKGRINAKFVHIVAPTVWAYKPERAAKFAKIYDLLLALLPFEPEFFIKEGLKTEFVGHYIFEQNLCEDKRIFRIRHGIKLNEKLILITPGSRMGEVKTHLKIFLDAIKILNKKMEFSVVILAATDKIKTYIEKELRKRNLSKIFITSENKYEAYKSADVAIAKSGTNNLEISIHGTPIVTCYKLNFLSWAYIKLVSKIKFANLVNIMANKEIIPEFLQENCTAEKIASQIHLILNDKKIKQKQIEDSKKILNMMRSTKGSASELSERQISLLLE